MNPLETLIENIQKEILSSRNTSRTGDYRIGLRKALDIAYDLLETSYTPPKLNKMPSNGEEYIGRKMRGFEFESSEDMEYTYLMDDYIGREGEILAIIETEKTKYFKVIYSNNLIFHYPIEQAIAHLVPEE